jgi:hypothetical protein
MVEFCLTGQRAVQARLRGERARGTLAAPMPVSRRSRRITVLVTIPWLLLAGRSRAAESPPPAPAATGATMIASAGVPLGISYGGWRGDFRNAPQKLEAIKAIGFPLVAFIPTYAYVGLNKIDLTSGPDAAELGAAVEAALRGGLAVVIKPHLDPPAYHNGFDPFRSDNDSWRVGCPWRGFFDLDPMGDDYRDGVVFGALRMLKGVLDRVYAAPAKPIRLELGVELMNSMVYGPQRWELLLAAAKKERHRLGLDGKVILSHNFTHHLEIPDDYVNRMTPAGRKALGRYIRGLDAIALSQYMDLTVAVPAAERGQRLPTIDEVADALVIAEKNFRHDILETALGLRAQEIPPLHIGEFGVGRGGLRHPNLWSGDATPAQERQLALEIARGHEGLLRYLARSDGRTAQSAILWITGAHYDIFGWERPQYANPEAVAAIKAALRR